MNNKKCKNVNTLKFFLITLFLIKRVIIHLPNTKVENYMMAHRFQHYMLTIYFVKRNWYCLNLLS